jgi:hypothetical protein
VRHLKALTLGILGLLAGAARAQQPLAAPAPQNVRGDIVALTGDDLAVKSHGGETLTVKLADNASVGVVAKADPTRIGNGDYLGASAVPQPDGTLRAIEVHVLPESMRGKGEGHRPWDLQPGSTMTNATVGESKPTGGKSHPPSTMTNATVANVSQVGAGRKLVLKYKGGEKTVVVPPDTPVVTVEVSDRSRLVPGAHVVAVASRQADGTLLAQRVYVGKDGVVPPM